MKLKTGVLTTLAECYLGDATDINMTSYLLLSTPMGVDYVVIGFDMKVQPLVTHNAAGLSERYLHRCHEQSFAIRAYAMSAVGIGVMSIHKLFAYRFVSTVSTDIVSSPTKFCRIAYGITR